MQKKRVLSKSSLKIIALLKKGISSRKIERMGFSRSTIRYNRYKLFDPKQYKRTLDRIKSYGKKQRKSK